MGGPGATVDRPVEPGTPGGTGGRDRRPSRHRDPRSRSAPDRLLRLARQPAWLLSLTPALVATAVVQRLSPATGHLPTGQARFGIAGAWISPMAGALDGYRHWFAGPPTAWLQAGLLDRMLLGGSVRTVLAAAQDVVVLVALTTVALFWLLARRLGASGLAAGAAAAVLGIAPIAVATHAALVPVNLAVPWLLGSALLVLVRRPGRLTATAAGVAAGVAVLTAPVTAPAVPLLALAVAQRLRREQRGRRSGGTVPAGPVLRAVLPLVGFLVPVVVIGVAAAVLAARPATPAATALNGIATAASAQDGMPAAGAAALGLWVAVDPLSLVLAVVALALAARSRRGRALVVLVVLVAAASVWPLGADPTTPLVALLPVLALVEASAVDRAVVALGRPRFGVSLAGSGVLTGFAAVLLVAVVVAIGGLGAPSGTGDRAVALAGRWTRTGVPSGQVVLVDLATWPDLSRSSSSSVGWYAVDPVRHTRIAASRPWGSADYVLADATLRQSPGPAAGTLRASQPVATFGSGSAALQMRAVQRVPTAAATASVPVDSPTARRVAEARRQTGAQVARNPRLTLTGADRAALTAGRVDARLAIVLGQLMSMHTVRVAAFPAITADGGIRRRILIDRVDGRPVPGNAERTGVLLRYFSGLRGDFAAESMDATSQGVLVAFPVDPTFRPAP